MARTRSAHRTPHKPWFLYYSTGCSHAPHHVAKEWADKYKGKFDDGWDAYREQTLERQKKLGIVPPRTPSSRSAPTSSRPGTRSATRRRQLYARQMEVFAGYSENADWNVGRLLDAVEEMGELDNTLVIYIWGDNGASMEGTLTGSFNETTFFNGVVLEADEQLELIEKFGGIEELGGFHTAPHFAAAWAHANNTPFQWGKQMASHLGGTRDPMVVAWPGRITAGRGDLRSQFTHCIDVGPDDPRAGRHPRAHEGRTASSRSPWTAPASPTRSTTADAAEQHTVQYFENYGSRAIYKDGWWACAKLDKLPWDFTPGDAAAVRPGSVYDPDQDAWELYYLPDDFTQAHDLAAENPEKLAELKELFWQEAERNRVLPLLGGFAVFFGMLPPMPTITRFDVRRRRAERPDDDDPAHHRALVRHRGRAPRAGRRRRGRRSCAFADFIGGFVALGRREGPAEPHLPVPRRRDLQADVDRADPDRRRDREDALRGRRAQAGRGRHGHALGQRQADRRGQAGQDDLADLHDLRRHGHRPRQRRRRRPRLRGQGALRVHRHGQAGRLRPDAVAATKTEKALHEHEQTQGIGAGAAG